MICCGGKPNVLDDEVSVEAVVPRLVDEGYEGADTNACDDGPICKMGCGKAVQPGLTRRGNPYDTCCRSCVVNPGIGFHDPNCGGGAKGSGGGPNRPGCPKGSRCRDRSAAHLESHAHPLDQDYPICCAKSKIDAEPVSLKVVFDWADADGSGKLSMKELQDTMAKIQEICGESLPKITEAAWKHLDEDGNGVVNFHEFASWAGPRLGLPLGTGKMMTRAMAASSNSCHVMGCPCEHYEAPLASVACMPCKVCKHKKELHAVKQQDGEVHYPDYWDNADKALFNEMVNLPGEAIGDFQAVFDRTYSSAFTRDRRRHNPTRPQVPNGYRIVKVTRNENQQSWAEYALRRADIMHRFKEEGKVIEEYPDIKSMMAWEETGGGKAGRLSPEINEWYLFHGTNPDVARKICQTDFMVGCAGSNTGTLYGKGMYFAESITKADEYSKPNAEGTYAVLFVRVIGGKVKYCDEEDPDPEQLVRDCIEGPYDSVLGDREKLRRTYREFVLFDSEDVYPEYIIEYKRIY